MVDVFRRYERRKDERGLVDFEDLLELAIRMFDGDPQIQVLFRDQHRAITVDEFQDVNLLQWTLLQLWLGGRDELCVVGDDHQAIYGFTGATPRYLLDLQTRHPRAVVVRLETNYRSTPQVLALANRLTPRLGGVEKQLRAVVANGPEPEALPFATAEQESAHVVERLKTLAREGVPYEDTAILVRVNSRSEGWEEALRAAGIPYRVRGGAFLARPGARRLRARLAGSGSRTVAAEVRAAAEAEGLLAKIPEGLGEYETTRQHDLHRLVELAGELEDGELTAAGFFAALETRFGEGGEDRGVNLLTLHRAKGLEFEAVFLPKLEEKELPARQARGPEQIAEERRLLYVGITRAKRYLTLSWVGKPSPFLLELGLAEARPRVAAEPDDPKYAALRRWRLERALADDLPAYVVFHNATLAEIVRRRPATLTELAAVPGVGPAKLERYGSEVLEALAAHG
jgi:DNA helicase II / ATP-dependent DNA helicase PcrA